MSIFTTTKELVKKEKNFTALILKNLAEIESKKLFADLKYPSLYKYLLKELRYSEGEANIRTNATRLLIKSPQAADKISENALSLTNAALAYQTLQKNPELDTEEVIGMVSNKSTRQAIKDLHDAFDLKFERQERIVLNEYMLIKMDKLKLIYNIESTYELIDILVEEKLQAPVEKPAQGDLPTRQRSSAPKNSRYIPTAVKAVKPKTKCDNCATTRNLEYDHIKSFSRGGDNGLDNIQVLCRSCNQRKAIKEMGHHKGKKPS